MGLHLTLRPRKLEAVTTTAWQEFSWGFPARHIRIVNKTPAVDMVNVQLADNRDETGIELSSGMSSRDIDISGQVATKLQFMSPVVGGATFYAEVW